MSGAIRRGCYLLSSLLACALSSVGHADALLADFDYPHPVQRYDLRSQGQPVTMAYMDAGSAQPNGKTVVLLHGKNLCDAIWQDTK